MVQFTSQCSQLDLLPMQNYQAITWNELPHCQENLLAWLQRGAERDILCHFPALWLHNGRRPTLPSACYIWCITPWGALVNIWTSKHRWLNAWLPWVNRWHSSRSPISVLPGSLNLWQTKHKVLSCITALQVATDNELCGMAGDTFSPSVYS